MNKKVIAMTVWLCLLLCGCENTGVNLERYTLADNVSATAWNNIYKINVKMVGILSEGALVVKTSEVTLRPAMHHRWESKLEDQLAVIFSEVLFTEHADDQKTYEILVTKFNGSLNSDVEIEAVLSAYLSGKKVIEKSLYFKQKQPIAGFKSMVITLGKGWRCLCEEFATVIAQYAKVAN